MEVEDSGTVGTTWPSNSNITKAIPVCLHHMQWFVTEVVSMVLLVSNNGMTALSIVPAQFGKERGHFRNTGYSGSKGEVREQGVAGPVEERGKPPQRRNGSSVDSDSAAMSIWCLATMSV